MTITGSQNLKPIKYLENKEVLKLKVVLFSQIAKTNGKSIIKSKKSRDHTERLFKYLKLPLKLKEKNFDLIEINKVKKIRPLNYKIPSDLSSCAFFIALKF